jgi:hypothetical protein
MVPLTWNRTDGDCDEYKFTQIQDSLAKMYLQFRGVIGQNSRLESAQNFVSSDSVADRPRGI